MSETNTTTATATPAAPTSDATVIKTDNGTPPAGTVTQAAPKTSEATQPEERTFTQADVDRIVQDRLKAGIKAGIKKELAKLTKENTAAPTVEALQQQLGEYKKTVSTYSAKEAVRDFLTDPAQKLSVAPQNMRAIEKLVMSEIVYDEETGEATNIADAVKAVQSLAPALFAATTTISANANAGRNAPAAPVDMNALIRQAAARK